MINCCVVGYGEVGQAVATYLCTRFHVKLHDPKKCLSFSQREVYVLAICIPYSKEFIKIVKEYQIFFKPKITVIFSTIPIGTVKKIPNAVHAPIEGKHPNIDLFKWEFIVGYNDEKDKEACIIYDIFVDAKYVKNTDTTEAFKLLSTLNYAVNIEFARYVKELCDYFDLDYDNWKRYTYAYNKLYQDDAKNQRYVLEPPKGAIGGHCVLANAEILHDQFYSIFTRLVLERSRDNVEEK